MVSHTTSWRRRQESQRRSIERRRRLCIDHDLQRGGVKQYVQLVGKGFVGIRASDGKVLWRYAGVANNVANIPSVLVDGDFVSARPPTTPVAHC